ncbi:MAK10-like protein [Tanacetum coccineum]
MENENPIRTLGYYSRPSHAGYRNTIELPDGNNVDAFCEPTPSVVQTCSIHGLRFEDPNQHHKDFQKLVDSLDLDVGKREIDAPVFYFNFSLPGDQATNWLEFQIFYDHVNPATRRTIDQSAGGKLRNKNAKESWALLEDLALYDNESWNNPRDLAKPVKAISLPQDIPSTPDRRLIKLKNQVQRLMEAHLAPKSPVQVNKIASSCEICSGPHDTQYCMENPEQAFVEYASLRTDKAGGKWYTFKPEQNNLGDTYNPSWKSHPNLSFMASQDDRLSKFEADFKQQQGEMTNKINRFLKAINDRMMRVLPSDTNSTNAIKMCSKQTNNLQKDQLQTVIEIGSPKPEELKKALKEEFKDLHFNLPVLEVLAHAPMYNALLDKYVGNIELGKNGSAFIQDRTKSYPIGIVKNVEVHIGRLKLLDDFYIIDMDKDPATPLLVGIGFLATVNAVIDFRKAKIAVGEGITRSIFGVKEISLGDKEIPYWTTLGKRESYEPCFMLRNTLWNTICPGNGKWPEIPCSTRLRTS